MCSLPAGRVTLVGAGPAGTDLKVENPAVIVIGPTVPVLLAAGEG